MIRRVGMEVAVSGLAARIGRRRGLRDLSELGLGLGLKLVEEAEKEQEEEEPGVEVVKGAARLEGGRVGVMK